MSDASTPIEQPSDVSIYDISGEQPVQGTVHPSEVTESVASGNFSLPKGAPVKVVAPDGSYGTIDPSEAPEAFQNGYKYALPEDQLQEKYGTLGQEVKTGLEGAAKGLLGPIATGLERAAGVKAVDIRGREQANPYVHGIAEAGTFLGSALTGTGEAALLGDASKALEASGALMKGGKLAQLGNEAVKAAFEGALYQGGEELHKVATQDPDAGWGHAVGDIGMTAALSGLFGGPIGYALRSATPEVGQLVSELDKPGIVAGDLRSNIAAADSIKPDLKDKVLSAIDLGKKKGNADAISKAAKELGAPVLPGMDLESPLVQTTLDSLLHSRYTVAGNRVGNTFDEAWGKAQNSLEGAVSPGSTKTQAQIGNELKEGITNSITEQYKPIKAIYEELKGNHEIIPLSNDAAAVMSKELREVPEVRVAPSSAEGQLVNRVLNDIKNVKTVNDLNVLKNTIDVAPTASSGEKRMAGILRDKIGEIEETSIEGFAKKMARNDEAKTYIQSLIDQKKAVSPQYKELINKVKTLSEQLGKGKVHGIQDALHFLNERLTPEEVTRKLFSGGKDSEFLNFFKKNFPEQFQSLRNYQRAGLKEAATGAEGEFSAKRFFNKFNNLEPEIQKMLYSPAEIKKIGAAETYLRDAFPKNFNPSGTAHMLGLHDAFASPKGLITANLRDAAIEKLIASAEHNPIVQQSLSLARATVKGADLAAKAVKSIFDASKPLPKNVIPLASARVKLAKLVQEAAQNPNKLVSMNDNNQSQPGYSVAMAASAGRVTNYIDSLRPKTDPVNPLDSKRIPSSTEKARYERALDIAEQPLTVLKHIKDGRLTANDMVDLRTMHPNVYNNLSSALNTGIIKAKEKGQQIPYRTRMGLSLFLGQPLDSTLTPNAIQSSQAANQSTLGRQPNPSPQGQTANAAQGKGLEKLPKQYMTPEQTRQAARAAQKH